MNIVVKYSFLNTTVKFSYFTSQLFRLTAFGKQNKLSAKIKMINFLCRFFGVSAIRNMVMERFFAFLFSFFF